MHESLWTDHQLRAFLSAMRGGILGPGVEDEERAEFVRQAQLRIVPDVQRRVLEAVGAAVDAHGVAIVAFELLEESAWDRRRTWLMASSNPWSFLADLVVRELSASYRETARDGRDDDELAGIAAASSRPALGKG